MKPTFEEGRRVVELRPAGMARWFEAGFLIFWLAGWAVGEAFGLTMLVAAIGALMKLPIDGLPKLGEGTAGMAGAMAMLGFLAVWLSFWTLGGVLAATRVLQTLWGMDRIEWDGAGVRRVSRLGPFRRTRFFSRDDIRGVAFRRGGVVLETARAAVPLTNLGSRQDHAELRAELERSLALLERRAMPVDLPTGWESAVDLEGIPVLQRSTLIRRRQAMFVSAIFLALATAVGFLVAGAQSGSNAPAWVPTLVLSVLMAGAGAGASWLWFGGEAIRLKPSHADVLRWFGSHRWLRAYPSASIRLEHSTDSDGDDWYKLVLRGAPGARTIASALHDSYDLERLGRWMAARLGRDLELGGGVRR